MSALEAFHFLRPGWLLLLVPFVLLLLIEKRRNDYARQWRGVIADHLLRRMMVREQSRSLLSPPNTAMALALLIALAMAGPSWRQGESPFAEDGAALVIAVDLSASMAESDVQPNRLQRARDKILQLVRARGDAATGLIAYAGTAHTVLPLTGDSTVLLHYVDALRVGMLPREGKSPENVIAVAEKMLAERSAGTLLLVSDGATNAAADAFAELADRGSMQLLILGVGKTQAALDADADRGLVSNAQPLQEDQLRNIADAAGGSYQRLTPDDGDVRRLLRHIERQYRTGEDSARPWIDTGYWLLLPIIALYSLWFRRGWVLRW